LYEAYCKTKGKLTFKAAIDFSCTSGALVAGDEVGHERKQYGSLDMVAQRKIVLARNQTPSGQPA
jgi:hypothetical protein